MADGTCLTAANVFISLAQLDRARKNVLQCRFMSFDAAAALPSLRQSMLLATESSAHTRLRGGERESGNY